jgi:hypothetical protein
MTAKLVMFATAATGAEEGAPDPGRIVEGSPANRTWNHFESPDSKLHSGVWESGPGKWRIDYDETEFCHIIEGVSVLADDDGVETVVRAGDAFVIPSGFRGTWEVRQTTRKHYVIYLL